MARLLDMPGAAKGRVLTRMAFACDRVPCFAFSEKGPDRWNNPQRWKYLVHYDRHVLRGVQTGARFRFAGIALGALVRRAFYHFALAVQHKHHRAGERWDSLAGGMRPA
jgi:hypothetical protein